jgi:hypothetical protein
MIKLFKKTPQRIRVMAGPFRGAMVYMNPVNAKRKLVGIYEHVLNEWISKVAPKKEFIFDVGANNGYDTYGLAYLASHANSRGISVVSFEPGADQFPELTVPQEWEEYSNCKFEIIKKFVGENSEGAMVTLDKTFEDRSALQGKKGLIKIDVEGHECAVLKGAECLLAMPEHDWLVEIHGKERILPVAEFFAKVGRPYLIKELTALPFFGKECREIETFWLVTI